MKQIEVNRLGAAQVAALQIYVFDVAHEPYPGRLDGSRVLTETDRLEEAEALLTDAINSAAEDGDAQLRDALTAILKRIRATSKKVVDLRDESK